MNLIVTCIALWVGLFLGRLLSVGPIRVCLLFPLGQGRVWPFIGSAWARGPCVPFPVPVKASKKVLKAEPFQFWSAIQIQKELSLCNSNHLLSIISYHLSLPQLITYMVENRIYKREMNEETNGNRNGVASSREWSEHKQKRKPRFAQRLVSQSVSSGQGSQLINSCNSSSALTIRDSRSIIPFFQLIGSDIDNREAKLSSANLS